jgi:YD repeat-containing protein
VEFEFEPNSFNYYKIISKEDIDKYYHPAIMAGTVSNGNQESSIPYATFTVPFTQVVSFESVVNFGSLTVCQVIGSGSWIQKLGANSGVVKELKITDEDCYTQDKITDYHKTDTITLEAGDYMLRSARGNAAVSWANVYYSAYQADPDTLKSIGSGVRIKNIVKKDHNNDVIETINYCYEDTLGRSSGRLLSPIKMTKYRHIGYLRDKLPEYHWEFWTPEMVTSSPVGIHPAQGCSTPIGYSRVTKEIIGSTDNAGKTVSHFSTTQAETIGFGMLMFPPHNNGSLIKKQFYDSNNTLKKEEIFKYEITDVKKEMLNVLVEDGVYGLEVRCEDVSVLPNPEGYSPRFDISLYPSVSYWTDLTQHTETMYYGNSSVTSTQDYLYNSYHQPMTITRSSGDSAFPLVEEFRYPSDLGFKDMKDYNVISPVVWYYKTIGNSTISINNTYAGWQDKFMLTSTREIAGSPIYPRKVSYKYDPKWNPVEVTYQDSLSTVYLWGYNYTYIIACIKNATYETVTFRMGNDLATLCSAATPGLSLLNRLRTLFLDKEVTTWLHDPSFGVIQQTDPRGITTTYDYDSFGRLQTIKDENNNTIESYEYHYKN